MTPQQYQKLKETIQKVCPEIMALEFGCDVKVYKTEGELLRVIGQTSICKKHKNFHEECWAEENGCECSDGVVVKWGDDDGWGEYTFKETEIDKILGKPITIANVLRALQNKDFRDELGDKVFVNLVDNGMFETDLYNWEEEPIFWDLTNDSLDWHYKNRPDTVQFLYDILIN